MNVRVCAPRFLSIGRGVLLDVPNVLSRLGAIKNPLIVTDKFMSKSGVSSKLQALLAEAGLQSAVFDSILPDPTDVMVLTGIDVLESGEHDAVIGLGGGSPIDAAKAIAVMATGSRDIQDYRPPVQSDNPGLPTTRLPWVTIQRVPTGGCQGRCLPRFLTLPTRKSSASIRFSTIRCCLL